MVLPQGVLRLATKGPVLVELKNGDSYSGTLVAVDNLMNIRLEDIVFVQKGDHKFEKLKECTMRGQFVKFIRFPDELLEEISTQEARAFGLSSGSKGRGRGGKGGGRGRSPPVVLSVPGTLVGTIIGRGGETVKKITAESGAKIEIAKDQPGALEERQIFLSGPAECVERAQAMINAIVQERSAAVRERGERGHDRGGQHKGGGSGHTSRSGHHKGGGYAQQAAHGAYAAQASGQPGGFPLHAYSQSGVASAGLPIGMFPDPATFHALQAAHRAQTAAVAAAAVAAGQKGYKGGASLLPPGMPVPPPPMISPPLPGGLLASPPGMPVHPPPGMPGPPGIPF